jgi:hypothetical protein
VLLSELTRHKAQLAVNAGNEDLLKFFFRESDGGPSYIEDLMNRATSVYFALPFLMFLTS